MVLNQLALTPSLAMTETVIPLNVRSQPDIIDAIDAGSEVAVWENGTEIGRNLRVVAKTCDQDAKNPCVIWVNATKEEVVKILKADQGKLIVIVLSF